MILFQALRYPFREKGSFRSLFLLTLMQLFPVIGQVILLGYGLASASGIDSGEPNGLSLLLFLVVALLLFVIAIALSVGGVRYALAHQGLFAPTTNTRLLWENRTSTGVLVLNILLLDVLAGFAIPVGLALFLLPGLFALVVCSLAFWYLFAWYGRSVGIEKPDSTVTRCRPLISKETFFPSHTEHQSSLFNN